MATFRRKGKKGTGAINTSSLPDIIFMLLFFFMVSTTMKEVTLKVAIKVPTATEITKLERKSLVTNIFVGKPLRQFRSTFGSEPRIQLNDAFSTVKDIESYIAQERESMKESDRPKMTVSIRADWDTPMGTITDIKQALRNAQALKISYSAHSNASPKL